MSSASNLQHFPLLKLPIELRNQIYELSLPHQTTSRRSSDWADITNISNKSMSLLLVSKQVSDEAQHVLYGPNTFTMVFQRQCAMFLGARKDALHFQPLQASPSLPLIKNWQLSLGFHILYSKGGSYEKDEIADGILTASADLATIANLQSLKVSIPCLCLQPDLCFVCKGRIGPGVECICPSLEDVNKNITKRLEPLKQLRFKSQVQFITAPAGHDETTITDLACSNTNEQCQQPNCLALAASFESLRATLRGKEAPARLPPMQCTWLALKRHATQHGSPTLSGNVQHALHRACVALDLGLEDFFDSLAQEAAQIIENDNQEQARAFNHSGYQFRALKYQAAAKVHGKGFFCYPLPPARELILLMLRVLGPNVGTMPREEYLEWKRMHPEESLQTQAIYSGKRSDHTITAFGRSFRAPRIEWKFTANLKRFYGYSKISLVPTTYGVPA
ncbi:MAG: hypothetical protein LQ346_007435 [Caloplaca aetnensis]|nr:MAG: hypothetical protein LQ346_007435 [Caloplaca aetnensis]